MKYLIVVDVQNDFVDGALGSPEAQITALSIIRKVEQASDEGRKIYFTRDTHLAESYMDTLEGKKLPIPHCIRGTEGWKIIDELQEYTNIGNTINKFTFGYDRWDCEHFEEIEEIEIIGFLSDICVISNALILRALYPSIKITVDAACCAGTSIEKHKAALEVMKSCQIDILNEY